MKLNAIGLVRVAGGVDISDRWWYRAIVVRHAHDHRLQLVDVLELSDDGQGDAQELSRLAAIAAQSDAVALVTHGIRPDLARDLADDLAQRTYPHQIAPATCR